MEGTGPRNGFGPVSTSAARPEDVDVEDDAEGEAGPGGERDEQQQADEGQHDEEAPAPAATQASNVKASRWIKVHEAASGDSWFVDEATQQETEWELPEGGIVVRSMEM